MLIPSMLPRLALSIRQPWAWLILHAGKDIENRQWSTRLRGPVAIHAAQGMTRAEYEDGLATAHAIGRERPFPSGLTLPAFDDMPRGAIVGTARIVDCVSDHASPWFFGRYGFVLVEPAPLAQPVPVKGALGFFEWRDRVIAPAAPKPASQGHLL